MLLLFLKQWLSDAVVKAAGWTFVHSLWQGLLAAVTAAIVIASTKRSAARLRYNLLGVVLLMFVASAIVTFTLQLSSVKTVEVVAANGTIYFSDVTVASTNSSSDATLSSVERFIEYFNANAGLFVLVWAIFFLFHCLKLMVGLAGVQRMKNYKTSSTPDTWRIKTAELAKRIGVRQAVILLQSALVKVPVAVGYLKPVILVPMSLLSNLPGEQVETILLHELAHIKRRDYLVNIIQRMVEAVFFFNPALLWISSLLRQEREACCDDIVVANTTHKGNYLEALVSFQEQTIPVNAYAMGIHSRKTYLLNRVKRMITRENKKLDVMEKIFLGLGLVTVTAFTFIPKNTPPKEPELALNINVPTLVIPTVVTEKIIPPVVAQKQKLVKKENKKVAPAVIQQTPIDTVPGKKEKTDKPGKTDYKEYTFPNISSNINDDGKTKTESATVTDGNGKTYSYKKLNGKVTNLTVDGKEIPENEFGNYNDLFDRIDRAIEERRAERLMKLQEKRETLAERNQELKQRLVERQDSRRLFESQHHLLRLKEESLERSQKHIENKRKETLKLLEKLQRINGKPMFHGREISKAELPLNPKPLDALNVKINGIIDSQTDLAIQKAVQPREIEISHDIAKVKAIEKERFTEKPLAPFQYKAGDFKIKGAERLKPKTMPAMPLMRSEKTALRPSENLVPIKRRVIS